MTGSTSSVGRLTISFDVSYAAHLATTQGNEEIDALNALGIPVFDFLVLPQIAVLVMMMPLLYLFLPNFGFGENGLAWVDRLPGNDRVPRPAGQLYHRAIQVARPT